MPDLKPDSPAEAIVTPLQGGGVQATVRIPTYSGGVTFTIAAERDENDGDWRVFIPSPDGLSDTPVLIEGVEFANGIAYLGAPDTPVKASWPA